MELETLNAKAREPEAISSPFGRGKSEGTAHGRRAGDERAQHEQTIAGNVAEILEA